MWEGGVDIVRSEIGPMPAGRLGNRQHGSVAMDGLSTKYECSVALAKKPQLLAPITQANRHLKRSIGRLSFVAGEASACRILRVRLRHGSLVHAS